ncbi:PH domain-containing protein [Salinimicrobium catena]|uniref:PH domain-containing protein n=1 Tax=Salinimicrobium catena TaxID=390640 RepID=A0A1H5PJL8_9FLAO|nr:PH domain-containing protein [Salinimicrobium catena]SDL86079.1 PH domain-containing protein [Salinimicrobium catena]SEF13217.1 PH domain-containing protein [Salinimicrobium catena]
MGIFSSLMGNAGAVDKQKLHAEYEQLLTPNEQIQIGFKLVRDTFIFTDKRLILVDKQGLTGRKTEYLSVLYKSISRFSVETAGTFDLDAELKIWISGEQQPSISRRFNKSVNVYEVQQLLATHVLK